VTLEVLERILSLAQTHMIENIFVCFEKEGCLDLVENYQIHQNEAVAKKALELS